MSSIDIAPHSCAARPRARQCLRKARRPRHAHQRLWFEKEADPPASRQLASAWRPFETCIEALGAEPCMFESNFPLDKGSFAYGPCWKRSSASRRVRLPPKGLHSSATRRPAFINLEPPGRRNERFDVDGSCLV